MGHRDKKVKLGRTAPHRDAMFRNMAMSLLLHRRIRTTDAKAKALSPIVDRLISIAKQNTLASKRTVAQTVTNRELFTHLYTEILPHFAEKTSGFTRIIKIGFRKGDNAPVSLVELLTPKPVVADPDPKAKGAKKETAPAKAAVAKPKKSAASSEKKEKAAKKPSKKTATSAGAKKTAKKKAASAKG